LAAGEDLELLAQLDRHGRLLGPGETLEEYRARLAEEGEALQNFEQALDRERQHIDGNIFVTAADRISDKWMESAGEITSKIYGFRVNWAPGFFVRNGVGFLWGGCAWYDPEKKRTVFLLRDKFRTAERYLIYSRTELVAHELCHVARAPFGDDWQLEEFFAYRTSPSALRRYLGNCFVRRFDALLFLGPALVLLALQLVNVLAGQSVPIWPAWALLVGCLGWLLLRNHLARRRFFQVRAKLHRWMKSRAQALMFRSTWTELGELARLNSKPQFLSWIAQKAEAEPRWRVIRKCFLSEKKKGKQP